MAMAKSMSNVNLHKRRPVRDRARVLVAAHAREYAGDLAEWLTREGYQPDNGRGHYKPNGRGVYRLISSAWQLAMDEGDQEGADAIAEAYVDRTGKPAWATRNAER